MFKSKQPRRNRNYQVKKFGIKDENIDRQILLLHRAMAVKLYTDKQNKGELYQQVVDKLESRYESGQMRHGEYITWTSCLMLIDSEQEFIQAITESSDYMRKLRRRTPLVDILTEQERVAALTLNALGDAPLE